MTKEKMIEHWMGIISCVFSAEDKLRGEWTPRLKGALSLSPDERVALCDDYLRDIATEILDGSLWKEDADESRLTDALGVMQSIFGIDIRKRSRMQEYVDLRMVFCYRMHDEGISYSAIGRAIGRDHSTVMNCCAKMKDALDYPNAFQGLVAKYRRFEETLSLFDKKDA